MSEVDNAGTAEQPRAEARAPLPPPSFSLLTLSLRSQAEWQLGLYSGDKSEEPPDFELARHSIDLLAILQEKTKGNLTLEEQRLLENTLTELRFRYVQAIEASKKS